MDHGQGTSPRRACAVSDEEREELRFVHRLVSASRVPRCDVEDIVQEVMIGVTVAAPRFHVPEGSTWSEARSAWVRGIVQRIVSSYRRQRVQDGRLDFQADMPSGDWNGPGSSPSAEALALARTSPLILNDGLSILRDTAPAFHAVLVAYELEGLPMGEVAVLLGISVNTAYNRLRLGRKALREHFRRLPGAGPSRTKVGSAPRCRAAPSAAHP